MSTTVGARVGKVGSVGLRVQGLREIAARDPAAARGETWEWFGTLRELAARDRAEGERRLDELFREGSAPSGLDGTTEGMLVAPLIHPVADRLVRALTSAWMPWLGKRFDATADAGDNVLADSARRPARVLWPLYASWSVAEGRAGFRFKTYVESGKVDRDRQVLVIDYENVHGNPRLIIKSIRDELVEIVPGAYLGKVLWRAGAGTYTSIGFFALRREI